jgi:hypothetical protein
LIISGFVTLMTIFRVSALANYDLPTTLVLLGSTGGTLSFVLTSVIGTISSIGLYAGGFFLIVYLANRIVGSTPSARRPEFIYIVLGTVGVCAISLYFTPWNDVVLTVVVTAFMAVCFALTIPFRTRHAGRAGLIGKRIPPHIDRAIGASAMLCIAIAAGFFMSDTAPYERLEGTGTQPFTGFVAGRDGDYYLVLTAGETAEIVRLPVGTTKRTLCVPAESNLRTAGFNSSTSITENRRTIPQLVLGLRSPKLAPCPERNSP